MPHLSRISTTNLQIFAQVNSTKKKMTQVSSSAQINPHQTTIDQPINYDYMTDYGLFEASRIACPVLPQYHPKQLMELLNSGKIRWVKAILAYLVRCIGGYHAVRGAGNDEESLNRQQVIIWVSLHIASTNHKYKYNQPIFNHLVVISQKNIFNRLFSGVLNFLSWELSLSDCNLFLC